MKAISHTRCMFAWWAQVGIDRVDLAVRKTDHDMVLHQDLEPAMLPLSWAKAQNVLGGEVYIRPARNHDWPLVFLDDVEVKRAAQIVRKYSALVVHTSHEGGCHVWLACTRALNETQRRRSQAWLATRINADHGSISGEHLGRLAGFKNWKRGGIWVNVLAASTRNPPWNPAPALEETMEYSPAQTSDSLASALKPDTSESAQEWGWVCGALEAGLPSDYVHHRLLERCIARRGNDARRYARRTLSRAIDHLRKSVGGAA